MNNTRREPTQLELKAMHKNDTAVETYVLGYTRKALIADAVAGDDRPCPVCGQAVKVYARKIHTTMAAGLVVLERLGGIENRPVHIQEINRQLQRRLGARRDLKGTTNPTADFSKLQIWHLAKSTGSGNWQITPKGVEFVRGRLSVPRTSFVLLGKCVGVSTDSVVIRETLQDRFDLLEALDWNMKKEP